jgi:hypothetical protein
MDRWFRFVNAYQRDHGYTIDEVWLRERIDARHAVLHGSRLSEDLLENVREQISLAYKILDFLKATGR